MLLPSLSCCESWPGTGSAAVTAAAPRDTAGCGAMGLRGDWDPGAGWLRRGRKQYSLRSFLLERSHCRMGSPGLSLSLPVNLLRPEKLWRETQRGAQSCAQAGRAAPLSACRSGSARAGSLSAQLMSRQLQITPQSCKSVAPSSHLCTSAVYCFCIKAFLLPFAARGRGSRSSAGRPGQAGRAEQPSSGAARWRARGSARTALPELGTHRPRRG